MTDIDWSNPPVPGQGHGISRAAAKTGRVISGNRVKGSCKVTQNFIDRMDQLRSLGLDCDPIQVLMEIAVGKKMVRKPGTTGDDPRDYDMVPMVGGYDKHQNPMDVDAATKAKAATELCSYIYPKRKAIEISGNEGAPISFAIVADHSPLPGEAEERALPAGPPTIESLDASADVDSALDKVAR